MISYNDKPKHWKYQLDEDYVHTLGPEFLGTDIQTEYFDILDSCLTAYAGYAWDGASGPTLDASSSMRASLVHDILYQCISEGLLPYSFRKIADKQLYSILRQDGFNPVRAWYYYWAVRAFGGIHMKGLFNWKKRTLK